MKLIQLNIRYHALKRMERIRNIGKCCVYGRGFIGQQGNMRGEFFRGSKKTVQKEKFLCSVGARKSTFAPLKIPM